MLFLLEAGNPDSEYVNIEICECDGGDASAGVLLVMTINCTERNQYLSQTDKFEER
jgi:hypothetical protein